MSTVLLTYHMDKLRAQAVGEICRALDISAVPVDESSHRAPIGLLSGHADLKRVYAAASDMNVQEEIPPIDEEMIVMSGFTKSQFDSLLDALREMGLRVGLKAVETETNQLWNGEMLQMELKSEREAFLKSKR